MLTKDELKQRLEAAKNFQHWALERMAHLKALDNSTRDIGLMLMGCDAAGKQQENTRVWTRRSKATKLLENLSEAETLRLGNALFPRFPDVFRAAWDLHARLPIQSGYVRKAYRAPHDATLLLKTRKSFLALLIESLEGYEQDLPWIAAHAAHLNQYGGSVSVGLLLAAAIDLSGSRGEEVEQILRDTSAGLHEVGQFGRHVTTAMMCSAKPDCWEFIEKLLLAAQRQEGLRQTILESIDFSHPDAFRRMLRVIEENNLLRFSATVRAADVWFGLQFDSVAQKAVETILRTVAQFLDDPEERDKALHGDDAERAYFALWSIAFQDVSAAVAPAAKLLTLPKAETRFIALHLLGTLGLKSTYEHVEAAVDDDDVRVAAYATMQASNVLNMRLNIARMEARQQTTISNGITITAPAFVPPPKDSGKLFERLEGQFNRMPEKVKAQKALVWPWLAVKADRTHVADALYMAIGDRPPTRLLPYLKTMSPAARATTAQLLGSQNMMDSDSRSALLTLVGDPGTAVRDQAVRAMRQLKIAAGDLPHLEGFLTRKASDLRRGLLGLILSLPDADAIASASRLMESKSAEQRRAGLDLLTQLREAGRSAEQATAAAASFKDERSATSRDEAIYLERLLNAEAVKHTLDDALDLMDTTQRTPAAVPEVRKTPVCTPAAIAMVKALNELIHSHREDVVTITSHNGDTSQQPLGGLQYGFASVFSSPNRLRTGGPKILPLDDLPLKDVWLGWWKDRPKALRDADQFEALRGIFLASLGRRLYGGNPFEGWRGDVLHSVLGGKPPELKYMALVRQVLEWMAVYHPPAGLADFAVDGYETILASIPADKIGDHTERNDYHFRSFTTSCQAILFASRIAEESKQWTAQHDGRIFLLERWMDEPRIRPTGLLSTARRILGKGSPPAELVPGIPRSRPDWATCMQPAFEAGFANEDDVFDHLLGPRSISGWGGGRSFDALTRGSKSLWRGELPPKSAAAVQRAIDRILEIELVRGETETAATAPALALKYAGGQDILIRVLLAIGNDPKLQRSHAWGDAGKGKLAVFSHLVRVTLPAKTDTPEGFANAIEAAGIDHDMLLAVAFYAPHWAKFVQAAIAWPMLEEAVWWIHAQTKDSSWVVDHEIREQWNAEVRKLTPLTLAELLEGAVDVEWFHRTYTALGPKRWKRLNDFAKYASAGGGHIRAQLFASAMLGKESRKELVDVMKTRRKQDAARALGLLPIDKKSGKKDLLQRYKALQEFIRGSRQFGSMRQASEKLAARIGQKNLARTAGYPDPIRLQWAMEGLASSDLAKGPVVVEVKDVAVSLAIDGEGLPEITVTRAGKPLKVISADLKKNEKVTALTDRKADLRRSASRMRLSLEQSMCRGDRFGPDELQELMGNAVLRPMLERLVFASDKIAGYPVDDGKGLRNAAGAIEPIKADESLRLAHPVDFLAMKNWSAWQHDCFSTERVQPFKQVFRELYVLTDQERSDTTFSRRYAGQQVNPRQALALLGTRGWITAPQQGVFRVFHDEKIVAWIDFMEGFYTPADVEGLTIEKVRFARRGGETYLPLTELPPRLFSETMRDVDLIVSVAHRGQVDPETSSSTVELRTALLRETLQLLSLKNVTLKDSHAFIKGALGQYSVHLGSATTHLLPGGALFIVPVQSAHRGRIFLPFADDDPKTAEIISKVLLLARDKEIRDTNLLDQIRSR